MPLLDQQILAELIPNSRPRSKPVLSHIQPHQKAIEDTVAVYNSGPIKQYEVLLPAPKTSLICFTFFAFEIFYPVGTLLLPFPKKHLIMNLYKFICEHHLMAKWLAQYACIELKISNLKYVKDLITIV